MPWRRNEDAAVEITALAAGAGPPAKSMATRRIWRGLGEEGEGEADILNSRQGLSWSGQFGGGPCHGAGSSLERSRLRSLMPHHARTWPRCIHPRSREQERAPDQH